MSQALPQDESSGTTPSGTPSGYPVPFDGLVTFFASLHAMRAEKVLTKHGFDCRLIPGPREISPHCGVALQFRYADAPGVEEALRGNKVQIEAIHVYRLSDLSNALTKGGGVND